MIDITKKLCKRKYKRLHRKKLMHHITLPSMTNALYDADGFMYDIELICRFPNENMLNSFIKFGHAIYDEYMELVLLNKPSGELIRGIRGIRYEPTLKAGIQLPYIMTFKNLKNLSKFKLAA